MKIEIIHQEPDELQKIFLRPLDFEQRVEIKKLKTVEIILRQMKAMGMNRSQLAKKMGVSSARITSMLDGTNNFTMETLMRSAEAVEGELELTIVPKTHKVRWVHYQEDDCREVFKPKTSQQSRSKSPFALEQQIAENDFSHAA